MAYKLIKQDDELVSRWVQYGVWSPILRLHNTWSPFLTREPWRFNDEARQVMNSSLRLRHRLVPYLYTMSVRSALEGASLIEPMYYDHPEVEQAYQYLTQFRYGTQLIVAPITDPRAKETTFGKTTAWLPPGRYVDIFMNMVYDGDREVTFHRALDKTPVLAKEGAIVPLDAAESLANGCSIPTTIEILVIIGGDGSFELVEDPGDKAQVEDIEFSRTPITYTHATGTLTIGPTSSPLLPMRAWSVRFASYTPSGKITATHNGKSIRVTSESTPTGTLVDLGTIPTFESIKISLGVLEPQLDKTAAKDAVFAVLDAAQIETASKEQIWEIVQKLDEAPIQVILSRLAAVEVHEEVREAVQECLLADSR